MWRKLIGVKGPVAALLLCVVALIALPGCSSTKGQTEVSERPWNAPRGWESGLPPSLYEKR
jgi:hypothetical protein